MKIVILSFLTSVFFVNSAEANAKVEMSSPEWVYDVKSLSQFNKNYVPLDFRNFKKGQRAFYAEIKGLTFQEEKSIAETFLTEQESLLKDSGYSLLVECNSDSCGNPASLQVSLGMEPTVISRSSQTFTLWGNGETYHALFFGKMTFFKDDFYILSQRMEEIELPEKFAVYFELDKSTLNKQAISDLKQISTVISHSSTIKYNITGLTDSAGSHQYNDKLGLARAEEVYRYLIYLGVPPSQLSYVSLGERKPRFSNNNTNSKALNRRAEISPVKLQ